MHHGRSLRDKLADSPYICSKTSDRGACMARFLHVKEKLINLDNIDYINTDDGEQHGVRIFFNGSGTVEFTGDDAEQLRDYLTEMDVVDRMPFFS